MFSPLALTLRMARRRPTGGVDTSTATIDAPTHRLAVEAATRAMDAFLAGGHGVAVLTVANRAVWSERRGMPRLVAPASLGS